VIRMSAVYQADCAEWVQLDPKALAQAQGVPVCADCRRRHLATDQRK
jgi:hypothetical protein